MREVYKEARVKVACYMSKSNIIWIQAAQQRKMVKDINVSVMSEVTKTMKFDGNNITLEGEVQDQEWEPRWTIAKAEMKKGAKNAGEESQKQEELKRETHRQQDDERHFWLKQKISLQKITSTISMIEQNVETTSSKVFRGLIENVSVV